jgi:hypothetical protein
MQECAAIAETESGENVENSLLAAPEGQAHVKSTAEWLQPELGSNKVDTKQGGEGQKGTTAGKEGRKKEAIRKDGEDGKRRKKDQEEGKKDQEEGTEDDSPDAVSAAASEIFFRISGQVAKSDKT